jgi:hypothetical protein
LAAFFFYAAYAGKKCQPHSRMNTPAITPAELCEAIKSFPIPLHLGATLNPDASNSDLPAGETGVLQYITPNGLKFIFSTRGFTVPGHGFALYQDVTHLDWADHDFQQKDDHKNYLQINFHDRMPVALDVGSVSVSLGSIIKLIKLLAGPPSSKG